MYSSGYGGGKSKTGCRESIRIAAAYAGSRNLVARYHYPDLEDTTLQTYFRELREIGFSDGSGAGPRHYRWVKSKMDLEWWNGSQTLFRNLDVGEKFGSLELSTAFVDEGSEVPDGVYQVLFPSRLRWHLPPSKWHPGCEWATRDDIDPEMLHSLTCDCPRLGWVCTNPGASGYLRTAVRGKLAGWEWFPAKPAENPYNGPEYNEEMRKLGAAYGPVWLARYVDGSWDAFEGQRFTMFDRSTHVLPANFEPSHDQYDIYEGWDFGFRNPTAVVWIAVPKDGEYPPVVFHEYELAEGEIAEHARHVRSIRGQYHLDSSKILAYGDPAGSQTRGTGVSDIMVYANRGIHITPCTIGKDPQARADRLALMFSNRIRTREGEVRGLMIAPRCERLIQAVLDLRFVPKRETAAGEERDPPEQFLKVNDHLTDALGYAIIAMPEAGTTATPDNYSRPPDYHRMTDLERYKASKARAQKAREEDDLIDLFGMTV